MSKQCAHCGKIQPSDNTRYCTTCGKILSSPRPVKRSLSGEPPAWMKQLESSLTKPLTNIPPRKPRVKVEEQEKTEDLSLLENTTASIEDEENVVDDLPTSPLSVLASPIIDAQPPTTSNQSGEERIDDEEIEDDLPTMPLIASLPGALPVEHTSSSPAAGNGNVARLDEIEKILTRPIAAQRQSISPIVTHLEKKSRKRLILVFALLFMLLFGGFIAWVILLQPFAVPEVAKTTQSFQNTHLGISLQYPQQWIVEVHAQNGTVYFYDDNHTDRVNIIVVASGGQGINQYISKVAGSLSMTGQKTRASLSFARSLWQQVQGNVQQSGATYLATLLVTVHGERYYTIVQLAPFSTYLHEDQLVFSKVRSSFQFL